MEQNQDYQRRIAAEEFQKSLDQLQGILQENPAEEEIIPEFIPDQISDVEICENLETIDLSAFEDAVADIEKYLETKSK